MNTHANPDADTLILKLSRGLWDQQMSAADELGKMKARAAVPALISALTSLRTGTTTTRPGISAIRALKNIGDEQALIPILRLLTSKDVDVRRAVVDAAISLGKISSQDVMELLIEHAQSSNQEGRVEAIEIICGLEKPSSFEIVVGYLGDPSKRTKRAAIEALGKLRDPRGVKLLVGQLHTTEVHTTEDEWTKADAIEALGRIGSRDACPAIMPYLDSPKGAPTRWRAATALGLIGDRQAARPLIKALRISLKEEDTSFLWNAVEALIKIDDENVLGELAGILTEIFKHTKINGYNTVRDAKIELSEYIMRKAASGMSFSIYTSQELKSLRKLEDWEAHWDPEGGPYSSKRLSFEEARLKAADALASRSWLRRFWRK
jgi:HEAT repeat protein